MCGEDEDLETLQEVEPEPEPERDPDLFSLGRVSAKLLALTLFEKRAIAYAHIARFWGSGEGRVPLKPLETYTERAVLDSEAMTITNLSMSDFHRFRQMQLLDALVQARLPTPATFTEDGGGSDDKEEDSVLKRRYSRELSAFTFPQVLSNAVVREPTISRTYYTATDELLVALTWAPPHRRTGTADWNPVKSLRMRARYAYIHIYTSIRGYPLNEYVRAELLLAVQPPSPQ